MKALIGSGEGDVVYGDGRTAEGGGGAAQLIIHVANEGGGGAALLSMWPITHAEGPGVHEWMTHGARCPRHGMG